MGSFIEDDGALEEESKDLGQQRQAVEDVALPEEGEAEEKEEDTATQVGT